MNGRYIAKSRASLEALKSANLLKSISVNALITGDEGVGKKTLALYVYDAPVIDGEDTRELFNALSLNDRLIIKNFEKIKNFDKLKKALNKHKTKILATSRGYINDKIQDLFFSLKIYIPPLKEREEDVQELAKIFYQEAKEIFDDRSVELDLDAMKFDLSRNCHSLRRDIYKAFIAKMFEERDILEILENFLYDKIGEKEYRELLYLFDVPILKAGMKRFKSQLAMSRELGLNRNTLRKKMNEYKDRL